jgi:signal transduction histidine kinase
LNRFLALITLVFWFSAYQSFAQTLDTDSLRSVLQSSEGLGRVSILNELGSNLRELSQAEALAYSEEAEQLSIDLKNRRGEAKAKENLSWIYYRRGQWQISFDYAEKAYQLAVKASDDKQAGRILNTMGALYYEQQNFQMAINLFKRAHALAQSTNDLYTQIRSLNNVGFNFTKLGELDSALLYANKSISINEAAGEPYLLSFAYRIIGDVYLEKNQLDLAEATFRKSLETAEIQGILIFKATLLHRLGYTLLRQERLNEAETYLKAGVVLASENSFLDELTKSHKYLAQVYEARGDIRQAYEEQSKYLSLNDSVLNQKSKDRLALQQGMFQDGLKKSELELLLVQNENQANRIQFIVGIIWVLSTAAVLILALGIWLIRLNKKTREQNHDLAQKSRELEKINQTKNKLFSILGHDLRGPVGQVKTCIDFLLSGDIDKQEFDVLIQSLKKDIDGVYLTLNNTLKWSIAQMDGFKLNKKSITYSEMIDSTLNLISPQLEEKGIIISREFESHTSVLADPDLIQIAIRNLIANAVKFSKLGDQVILGTLESNSKVTLFVTDQGEGMMQSQINHILSENIILTDSKPGTLAEQGSGLGLQICKEFIKMNGGQLAIESTLGKGTTVSVSLSKA